MEHGRELMPAHRDQHSEEEQLVVISWEVISHII
jgi:hypothetical protein